MRKPGVIALLAVLPFTIVAADMTTTTEDPFVPPPYQMLRFDEN